MTNKIIPTVLLLSLLGACSDEGIEGKKSDLYSLRDEQKSLNDKIRELEAEIKKEDPSFEAITENSTLVSIFVAEQESFRHRFEVRGSIASRKNIMVSSEVAGVVREIKVREGQEVKKGQVMVILDSESIRKNIDEIKTQLELAVIMFERQSRLWEQGVGSEIQYLEMKNRKESIERSLASAQTQLSKATIRAPFTGNMDDISVKEGEFIMMGMPIARVVSLTSLYIESDVSERFIGKLNPGDNVNVLFPTVGKDVKSTIVAVSDVIDQDNRTFKIEVSIEKVNVPVKPNMVVILTITDYQNDTAMVLPTKIIQRDDVGPFVYTVEENGPKKVARKLHLETGISFESKTEVKDGLSTGTIIVDDGFRDLTDGTIIEIADNNS